METTEVVVPVTPETPALTPAPVETASTEAAPVSGETTPEVKPAKTFSQAELDAIVAKEKARVERKVRRELAPVPQPTPTTDSEPQKPVISNFTTVEEYDAAMTKWADEAVTAREAKKAQQTQAAREAQERAQLQNTFAEREDAAMEKYADYTQIAHNPRLPITTKMAEVIQRSEQGPDIAYFLGKNPQEAARIAQLHPDLQAAELGRIGVTASAPAKKPSSAPEPINPVSASGGSGFVVDTTDPKSSEKLLSQPNGTSLWIEAERRREQKAWEQRHR